MDRSAIRERLASGDHSKCFEPFGATGEAIVVVDWSVTSLWALHLAALKRRLRPSSITAIAQELLERVQCLNRQHAHLAQEQMLSSVFTCNTCDEFFHRHPRRSSKSKCQGKRTEQMALIFSENTVWLTDPWHWCFFWAPAALFKQT